MPVGLLCCLNKPLPPLPLALLVLPPPLLANRLRSIMSSAVALRESGGVSSSLTSPSCSSNKSMARSYINMVCWLCGCAAAWS